MLLPISISPHNPFQSNDVDPTSLWPHRVWNLVQTTCCRRCLGSGWGLPRGQTPRCRSGPLSGKIVGRSSGLGSKIPRGEFVKICLILGNCLTGRSSSSKLRTFINILYGWCWRTSSLYPYHEERFSALHGDSYPGECFLLSNDGTSSTRDNSGHVTWVRLHVFGEIQLHIFENLRQESFKPVLLLWSNRARATMRVNRVLGHFAFIRV